MSDWYDVLTGKRDAENREEQIFDALRHRIEQDSQPSAEETLTELDLKRGQKKLRAAIKPTRDFSSQTFLSGIAAGIVATGFGLSVYFQVAVEQPVDKDLPDILTPSLSVERSAPESFDPGLLELASVLRESDIAFELQSDGTAISLSFKTPAPVPQGIAAWLEANQLEVLAATRYDLSFD